MLIEVHRIYIYIYSVSCPFFYFLFPSPSFCFLLPCPRLSNRFLFLVPSFCLFPFPVSFPFPFLFLVPLSFSLSFCFLFPLLFPLLFLFLSASMSCSLSIVSCSFFLFRVLSFCLYICKTVAFKVCPFLCHRDVYLQISHGILSVHSSTLTYHDKHVEKEVGILSYSP